MRSGLRYSDIDGWTEPPLALAIKGNRRLQLVLTGDEQRYVVSGARLAPHLIDA